MSSHIKPNIFSLFFFHFLFTLFFFHFSFFSDRTKPKFFIIQIPVIHCRFTIVHIVDHHLLPLIFFQESYPNSFRPHFHFCKIRFFQNHLLTRRSKTEVVAKHLKKKPLLTRRLKSRKYLKVSPLVKQEDNKHKHPNPKPQA